MRVCVWVGVSHAIEVGGFGYYREAKEKIKTVFLINLLKSWSKAFGRRKKSGFSGLIILTLSSLGMLLLVVFGAIV